MNNTEWLESLKVGDEVAVSSGGRYSIEKVTKVPKTQIVTTYGRYRKTDGISVGGSIWHISKIQPATESIRKIIRKSELVSSFSRQHGFSFINLSFDQLERIQAIINEGKK
jgi:hypothetical protein